MIGFELDLRVGEHSLPTLRADFLGSISTWDLIAFVLLLDFRRTLSATQHLTQSGIPRFECHPLFRFVFVTIVDARDACTGSADVVEHSFGHFDRNAECLKTGRAGTAQIVNSPFGEGPPLTRYWST